MKEKLKRLLSRREYRLDELSRLLGVSKSYIYTLLEELNVKMVKVWVCGDYFEPAYYLEGAVIGIERYRTKKAIKWKKKKLKWFVIKD